MSDYCILSGYMVYQKTSVVHQNHSSKMLQVLCKCCLPVFHGRLNQNIEQVTNAKQILFYVVFYNYVIVKSKTLTNISD